MPPASRAPRPSRRRTPAAPAADSPPYDGREEHELRRQILDAAHDLLIKRGYDRFSLREVARVLGKSSGSPYHHFATKQELIWTMTEEALRQVFAAVRGAAARAGDDPGARFEAMCRAYVGYGLAHPKHYEVVYLLDSAGLPTIPTERLRSGRMTLEFVAELIEDGMRTGVLRGDDSPLVTAGVVWAMLHGAVSIAIGNRLVPGQGLTIDQLIEATIRSILARYIVPRVGHGPPEAAGGDG